MYNQNSAALAPFQRTGGAASGAINALLGLGVPSNGMGQAYIDPNAAPAANTSYAPQTGVQNALSMYGDTMSIDGAPTGIGFGGYVSPTAPTAQGTPQATPQAAPQTGNALSQYQDAFKNYQDSTGYQFRLNQGQRAIGSNFAARGLSNSGAAAKSLLGYNQGMASNEFGNYLNQLAGQQNLGLSAASAQAGIGQNYVGMVSGNNNNAGTVAANAALARGQIGANLFGSIANDLGRTFSSFGSSFAGMGG